MDGGMSHLPEQIPRFIEAMERGVEFAAGSRFMPRGSYRGRWSRYLISKGGTLVTNLLLGTRLYDMTSGFECFTQRALTFVVQRGVESRAHFFQTEIRFMLHGWDWTEVPIDYSCPSKSVGQAQLLEAIRILWKLYRARRRNARNALPS
jgi:dolichol-phosphate mannosyltransferase